MTIKNKPTAIQVAKKELEHAIDHLLKSMFFSHQQHPGTAVQNNCVSDFSKIFQSERLHKGAKVLMTNIDENATHRTNDEFKHKTEFWLCFFHKYSDGETRYTKIFFEFEDHEYFLNHTMLGETPLIPYLSNPIGFGGPPSIYQKAYDKARKRYIALLPESKLVYPVTPRK